MRCLHAPHFQGRFAEPTVTLVRNNASCSRWRGEPLRLNRGLEDIGAGEPATRLTNSTAPEQQTRTPNKQRHDSMRNNDSSANQA